MKSKISQATLDKLLHAADTANTELTTDKRTSAVSGNHMTIWFYFCVTLAISLVIGHQLMYGRMDIVLTYINPCVLCHT